MTMTLTTSKMPTMLEIAEKVTSKFGMNVVAIHNTKMNGSKFVTKVTVYDV